MLSAIGCSCQRYASGRKTSLAWPQTIHQGNLIQVGTCRQDEKACTITYIKGTLRMREKQATGSGQTIFWEKRLFYKIRNIALHLAI